MNSSRATTRTAIDLFSGCGGMTTGLKMAGFAVLGAVEIDARARETYALNHPDVPLIGSDIRKLSSTNVKKALGIKKWELDLLAGCPPCQDFSTLRRRNLLNVVRDDRNKLIEDFQRFALELMPKLIMMENVAGLQNYSRFKAFVMCLRRSGYNVIYDVLDVADYGVPQRRKRLILSANYLGEPKLAEPNQQKK
jgi:DNA (cytosine-5)-methyltransferase 1